jgi:hypothetical protein
MTELSQICDGAIESLIFLCTSSTPETIGQNVRCHFVVELESQLFSNSKTTAELIFAGIASIRF